jgi:hypothetical protein
MTLQDAKDLILEERERLKENLPMGSALIWRIDIKRFPPELRDEVIQFLERLNIIESTEHLRYWN